MSDDVARQLAAADEDDIQVEDGLITIGDETLQPISGDDIREADLTQDASQTGLSEQELERAAKRYEADRLYNEAADDPSLLTRVKNKLSNAPDKLKSISRIFVKRPDYPRTVTVKPVGGSDGDILLTLDPEHGETREVSLAPDSHKLDFLLDYADVGAPSDLEEKEVPVKPRDVLGDLTYKLHTPKKNNGILPTYRWKRLMLRAGAYSHKRISETGHMGIHANRNFSLANALMLLAIGVPCMTAAYLTSNATLGVTLSLVGSLPLFFGAMFGLLYAVPVILGIVAWVLTVLFGEP